MKTLFIFIFVSSIAYAQSGSTAVPFLMIGISPAGNGMGQVRGSINNENASMATFNPGLLGVQSMTNRFSAEFYLEKAPWLPGFQLSDHYLLSNSATYGSVLNDYFDLPFTTSAGIGYSETFLNLGEFVQTTDNSPDVVSKFHAYERVDAISAGAAIQYWAMFGAGFNVKRIYSQLSSIGTAQETGIYPLTTMAFDVGTFITVPIIPASSEHTASQSSIMFSPKLDLSISYVYSNIGKKLTYSDANQSDPLPREITAGYNITGGIQMDFLGSQFDLIDVTLVREASDVAVKRTGINSWTYQYGMGDILFGRNLIQGKAPVQSELRKGLEIELLGILTTRKGSNKSEYREYFETEGIEMNLTGVFRLLYPLNPKVFDTPPFNFILRHLDIRIVKSSYIGTMELSGATFNGLAVTIK